MSAQPHYPRGFCAPTTQAVSLYPVTDLVVFTETLPTPAQDWLARQGFRAKAGQWCFFPLDDQMCVALGVKSDQDWRSWADAAHGLPAGEYSTKSLNDTQTEAQIRGWGSGSYRYRSSQPQAALCCPNPRHPMLALVRAERQTRFLIDHPANKLTTTRLAQRAKKFLLSLSPQRNAGVTEIIGDDLLRENFPLIATVGKASVHPPRLLDMTWHSPDQNPDRPLVTLIGKGVCFDTGGLDIKPRTAMLSMKKDMGGAAHTIGLAAMILSSSLNVRLRLILGIAENSISSNAMRPSDILRARDGTTIEVGDTDAEGRLVLADCLALAGETPSSLVMDFATLTGAARVALGTDLPAVFCNDERWAEALTASPDDPMWRMPLHAPYATELSGNISHLNSAPGAGYGGAIMAALFLEHFVPKDTPWAHIDLMAYTPKKIHGRAAGAAGQGLYACLNAIHKMF